MMDATSAFTAISTSRRARIPGSRRSSCRTPPIPITTGTSASPPSATRPTPPRASSTARAGSSRSSTTTRGSASTSAPRCSPGWKSSRPDVYRAILEADRESQEQLLGPRLGHRPGLQPHDPAAGQPPRQAHPGPLGHPRFRAPLRPEPGGMWLPETAVDLETLEVLAEHGHPLHHPGAPTRPRRVRSDRRARDWTGRAAAARSTRPWPICCGCPRAGRSPSSSTMARSPGPCLRRAARQAASISPSACWAPFPTTRALAAARPHRHRRRDLRPPPPLRRHGAGLRAALTSRPRSSAQLTNYGEYLEQHPPTHEVEIVENTLLELRPRQSSAGAATAAATPAASPAGTRTGARRCARRSTGCATAWPPLTSEAGGDLLKDPWAARDDYIDVILDRSPENVERFLARPRRARARRRAETCRAAQAARAAAPRHAHVHQLRLVLRRALGHRDRAGDSVCRARRAARRGAASAATSKPRVPRTARAGREQHPRARRRPARSTRSS